MGCTYSFFEKHVFAVHPNDHVEKAPYSDGKVIFLIRDEFGDGLVEPWSVFGRTRSPLHVVGYLSKGAGQT